MYEVDNTRDVESGRIPLPELCPEWYNKGARSKAAAPTVAPRILGETRWVGRGA
tara:strand:- start:10330 stop:10491 length:162 start_codon:yes stop_codon:yes gene_type:complete